MLHPGQESKRGMAEAAVQRCCQNMCSHHIPSICSGTFPIALPRTRHGLQPKSKLVVPTKPATAELERSKHSLPSSSHHSTQHLTGKRDPRPSPGGVRDWDHAEPSSPSLMIPSPWAFLHMFRTPLSCSPAQHWPGVLCPLVPST